MNRRELLKTTLAAGAAFGLGGMREAAAAGTPFRLKYAPHFGMFKSHAGEDLVDQLKFAADQGFTAWEDNGMAGRPIDVQERLAKEMTRLGLTMGVFVAMADFQNVTFASAKPEAAADIVAKARAAVEVAKRVNAKWTTVNYRNIFRHIHGKGFTGVLGMEHGNSKPGIDGEKALLDAYRYSDSW
jgi:hydroxypyruvate isomerase